jgi:hypothetical protein
MNWNGYGFRKSGVVELCIGWDGEASKVIYVCITRGRFQAKIGWDETK